MTNVKFHLSFEFCHLTLKKLFFLIIGFLGWILSPFTWWNDAFVNLPLAYLAAGLFNKSFPGKFLIIFLAFYWLTNFLGVLLMYIGASGLCPKGLLKDKIWVVITTVIVYSITASLLVWLKVIKPF